MPSDPLVLSFDTSAAHCAAALLSGERVLAQRSEAMARGQAERLVTLLDEVLEDAGHGWHDLDRIGVGIGPGNFTGIRIAVSAARGLALGLGIPAIGVDSFDAVKAVASGPGRVCVPGPRGQGYVRRTGGEAYLATSEELEAMKQAGQLITPEADSIAIGIARVAVDRKPGGRPVPLYIRPADAAPARDAAPVMLDDA